MLDSDNYVATSIDVVGKLLVLHSGISELTVFEPPTAPLAQQRLVDNLRTKSILEAGIRIRQQLGLPFWDSVLVSCFGVGLAASPVIEQALFHNSPPVRTILIPRSHWSNSHIADVSSDVASGGMLVVSSRVRVGKNEHLHIPMLDFHCPVNAENQEICERVANLIEPSGAFILNSGKSYHLYGKSLIGERDLFSFLGRALLLSPLVDRAWIAHQLIEGVCGLRISGKAASGPVPTLVAEIGGA